MNDVNKRIDRLEKQVSELRLIVLQHAPARAKVSFKGLLKGARVTEADIRRARRSLFSHARAK